MIIYYDQTEGGAYYSNPAYLFTLTEEEIQEELRCANDRGHFELVLNYRNSRPMVEQHGIDNIQFVSQRL